ncbi:MAG: formylmethionine deformylase [Candidatus Aminicenantes bacterium]|jgi:peptide deformylase|nr:formylmethionine deformylase [Candidatus Aminicenantes bacterium]
MPVRKIVTFGHPVLERTAEPVPEIDQEIRDLARDMVLTMHAAPGIGLAAPQVAVSKRVITVDLSVGENPDEVIILVNPSLLKAEGEEVFEEGCLSVPGIHENVKRPARVVVRGLDLEGKEKVIEADGTLARVFCHEIDHINGRLFIEKLSPLKKALVKKKLRKNQETGGGE